MKTLDPQDKTDISAPDAQAEKILFQRELEIDTLARTIWGEARGEGSAGMQAVACVIVNRLNVSKAHQGFWWGDDIISICQKQYQFSTWNPDDPNRRKVLNVDEGDVTFATAKRIARRAVYGALPDMTGGADHYHAAGVTPIWTRGERPVCVIGRHIFYKLVKDER